MFSIEISRIVYPLVKQLMKEKPEGKGLLFSFDVSLSDHSNGLGLSYRRELDLLYNTYSRNGTYISAFSRIGVLGEERDRKKHVWTHECTHDSCWRDLSVISNLYFEGARVINDKRVRAGLKEIAPRDMGDHTGFNIFRPAFEWVDVEQTKLDNDARFAIKVVG